MEFVFIALLLLAFPVIAIVGLVIAVGARDRVRTLETKFDTFQKSLPAEAAAAAARSQPTTAAQQTTAPDTPPAPSPPPQIVETPQVLMVEPSRPPEPVLRPSAPVEPVAIAEPAEPVPPPRAAAASVPPIAPPSPPPPPPSEPAQPEMGFEERLGTQWTVWVGGVALALGGFFLVRHAVEQGWFGPGMRIFLGALFALALIAAGEWARRKENLSGIGQIPGAHIPSILTAAGTAVAYADIYAAYALYEFIGAGAAFVLLGIVALGTLAAALVHGPALAGLGLVGAYVTPLIVSTGHPNYWALYIYLAVVTAAAFVLARVRLWRWLAFTAVAFSLFWTLPGLDAILLNNLPAHLFHVVIGFALAAVLIVSGFLFGPSAEPGKVDSVSTISLAAYLAGAALIVLASRHDMTALIAFVALVAATIAIAWRAESAVGAVPIAGVLVGLVFLQFAVNVQWDHLVMPSGPVAGAVPEPARLFHGTHLTFGFILAALFGGAGFLAQGRSTQATVPMLWAASAVFVPIAILVALYYRIYQFEHSLPFAGLTLLLAALFAVATELLNRREPRPGMASACAIFATGAVAALALALTMALEKGWLTIALALMVPGIAFVADKRPLPALRILCAVLVAAVLARVAWNPAIVGSDIGKTPIFNWLLWGYGIPAIAFWLGGHILRRRADDAPARMADAAALLFTVLLAFLEVRHYMTDGNIYARASLLAEIALHANIWLAMAIGLERLRTRTGSIIHNGGALIMTALAVGAIVIGLGIIANPMIRSSDVGGAFFNLIMLGYGLPAVLMVALAFTVSGRRPLAHSQLLGLIAVLLVLAYLMLELRRLLVGPVLTVGPFTLADIAWNVNILLVMAIALEWLRERARNIVHDGTALLVGAMAVAGIVLGLGIIGNPMIRSSDVGGAFFNLIMLGYGLPAVLMVALAFTVSGRRPLAHSQLLGLIAVLLVLAYLMLEVRRLLVGPVLTVGPLTLADVAWNVNILLAMTIALEWLRERARNIVHDGTALLVGAMAASGVALGLGIIGNPMINSFNVGGPFFNLIMVGYLFSAALTGALALYTRGRRPPAYSQTAAVVAVALAMAYLSLQVRRFFHGPILTIGPMTDAEQYTYSAVWLTFGVVLLAIGIFLRSQAVRYASAAVVIATVLKVFLIDMRDLTGIWQALSFIGLGVVLMGIGWFYQRLLFPRRPPPPPPPEVAQLV